MRGSVRQVKAALAPMTESLAVLRERITHNALPRPRHSFCKGCF